MSCKDCYHYDICDLSHKDNEKIFCRAWLLKSEGERLKAEEQKRLAARARKEKQKAVGKAAGKALTSFIGVILAAVLGWLLNAWFLGCICYCFGWEFDIDKATGVFFCIFYLRCIFEWFRAKGEK